jgi:hypothetical protein
MCSCFTDLSACPDDDDVEVPSCGIADVQCAGQSLSDCR